MATKKKHSVKIINQRTTNNKQQPTTNSNQPTNSNQHLNLIFIFFNLSINAFSREPSNCGIEYVITPSSNLRLFEQNVDHALTSEEAVNESLWYRCLPRTEYVANMLNIDIEAHTFLKYSTAPPTTTTIFFFYTIQYRMSITQTDAHTHTHSMMIFASFFFYPLP